MPSRESLPSIQEALKHEGSFSPYGRHDDPIINGTSPQAYPTQTKLPTGQQQSYAANDSRRISLPAIFPFDHRLAPPLHPSTSADCTPTSASSMNSNFTYPSYPPQYLYPAQPQPGSQALYQPLTPHHQRVNGPAASFLELSQNAHPVFRGFVGAEDHGGSVKRHLDYFDAEATFRDMVESSERLESFSKGYRLRVRDIQRTGCLPGMLPTIAECDEMIRHQHRIQEVLGRLREMLVTQQDAALSRHPQERVFKTHSDFEMEDPGLADDNKPNGNANPEGRKRRGRAAPPGRCHSCNRAETPEWRRGPDGARTLCNACGLHYAKLTRKLGPKASLSGTSLRPKSVNGGPGPSAPPPPPPQSS
ncbi:MAG: hypothetical protein M1816_001834 [Peltula sp. TS41687]|nr:MAG: hypothetical protein M1816_001834 [Peltula sp. TS41687]